MTSNAQDSSRSLRFFTTGPHPCGYLPERIATTLFLDPLVVPDMRLYTRLSELGFRRSGTHLYRPYCDACNACTPVRVPVAHFRLRRGQRRIWRRNLDLAVQERPAGFTAEAYALYARYLEARHADGDMYPPREDQFSSFLVDGIGNSTFYEFRLDERLVAVAVADRLEDGLSAIYTFFDPDDAERSPGVFAVLWLIESCKRLDLRYLYLGYWIEECRKMNYKLDYRPTEILAGGRWHSVE